MNAADTTQMTQWYRAISGRCRTVWLCRCRGSRGVFLDGRPAAGAVGPVGRQGSQTHPARRQRGRDWLRVLARPSAAVGTVVTLAFVDTLLELLHAGPE